MFIIRPVLVPLAQRYNEWYGPRFNPRFGFPQSPEPSSEEGVFRLPRFRGLHDEPTTFAAASSPMVHSYLLHLT